MRGATLALPYDTNPPAGSRALYQSVRIWLLDQGLAVEPQGHQRQTITPHSARHGFAQSAQAAGASLEDISTAMRHVRPDTTAGYVRGAGDAAARHLIEAIAKEFS